jgi:hypothetical protein
MTDYGGLHVLLLKVPWHRVPLLILLLNLHIGPLLMYSLLVLHTDCLVCPPAAFHMQSYDVTCKKTISY